ncbi:MAG: phosphatidylserine decarboxylase family protein [Verrucomicrobia bacterium]|nr:phosphatidylserine decarboxylase family protein [Verrucomicrobiota bacterium]
MKHSGKATAAALKLILCALLLVACILGAGVIARYFASAVGALAGAILGLWLLFTLFTLYFFRDPDAKTPADADAIVSPAHGTVDLIDETEEKDFLGGRCKRVSIFLSVIDIHVQQAPVAGKVVFMKHSPGLFLSALKSDCSAYNENVLLGFDSKERAGEKIAVRLIAGLIARRIVPFVKIGDELARGERTSLIQFGSRTDIFLPQNAKIEVNLGDKVVGGETIVARR